VKSTFEKNYNKMIFKITSLQTLVFICLSIFLFSCNNANQKPLDTPTSGEIKISVDESFQPLLDQTIDTFESLYTRAKINVSYKPEAEVVNDFMNDSVKVIISSKELSTQQLEYIKAKNILFRKTQIAVDAVAILVNNNNPDSLLKLSQLKNILNGSITNWNQVSKKNNSGEIAFVFDHAASSNTRFLKEKFMDGKEFSKNCFAVKSNKEVVDYVSKTKNAIGIIAVNWISDTDDATANKFKQQIRVADIQDDLNSQDLNYYGPYQGYIALKNYPLTREVWVMNRESRTALGTGFASFVAGDQGQRIVRLAGLLPATMPIRLINLK
jgi:phosphate transport system substrate-binding protein